MENNVTVSRPMIMDNRSKWLAMVAIFMLLVFVSCKSSKPVVYSQPIPQPKTEVKTENTVKKDTIAAKPEIVTATFSVIMPFELRENFAPVTDETSQPVIAQGSLNGIHFYEGCLLAADSLVSLGRRITVKAYDAPSDSATLKRLLSNPAVKSSAVIFATLPNHLSSVAAAYAEKNNLRLVITSAPSAEFLNGNPHVILSSASTITQCRLMVEKMLDLYPGSNIVLAWRKLKREDELANVFRSEINRVKGPISFHDINIQDKGYDAITNALSKTRRNLIFLISSDEAVVNPVLNKIEEAGIAETVISGLPTWMNFESIDFISFKNLRVHVFDNNYINYDDIQRQNFRKLFIKTYFDDPNPSAYNAFDLTFHLGQSYTGKEKDLIDWMNKAFPKKDIFFKFDAVPSGGYENKSISVLRYTDYKFEKLR
jgi:hypothetical protein